MQRLHRFVVFPRDRNFADDLPRETLITTGGEDVTEEVYAAYEWLRANTF